MTQSRDRLVEAARSVRAHAHAPYSGYNVGAALLTRTGEIFVGCNVENASFGLTICAERNAVAAAVAAGHNAFDAIAVVARGGVAPCGACRQVLREFSNDLSIYTADVEGPVQTTTIGALLPHAFDSSELIDDSTPDVEQ